MCVRRQADPPRSRPIKAIKILDHGIIEAFAYGIYEAIGPGIEIAGLQDDFCIRVRGQEFFEKVDAGLVRHGGVGAEDLVPVLWSGGEGDVVVVFGGEGAGPEGLVFRAGDEFLVVVAGGEAKALEGCLDGCREVVSLGGWQSLRGSR